MNTQQKPAELDFAIDPLERLLESAETLEADWRQLDSSFLDAATSIPGRVARVVRAVRSRRNDGELERWAAEVGGASDRPIDTGGLRLRRGGRQYSCALLALVDALAAEPSTSPLATSASLDDLRADAFLVAGEAAAAVANPSLIHRVMLRADLRLNDLRLPLRATGYLRARDDLLADLDRLLPAQPCAGGA